MTFCTPAISCSCSITTRPISVTDNITLRRHDVTGALRSRRYRAKKNGNETNASVTVDAAGVTAVSTPEMCALAARLGDGHASRDDMQLAERLIMALVDRLPADSRLDIRADEPSR
jgi:hypothetical protein